MITKRTLSIVKYFKLMLISIVTIVLNTGCVMSTKTIVYNELPKDKDSLRIREGIVCTKSNNIKYQINGKTCALIELSEPIMVAQAETHEEWGYYQFPSIGKAEDGTLIVTWEMAEDSYKSYGKEAKRRIAPMMSKDGGITWTPQDKEYKVTKNGYNAKLDNGDEICVVTPSAKNTHDYDNFPKVIEKKGRNSFYLTDSLPEDLQGVYFKHVKKKGKTVFFKAQLIDPGLLRYTIDDMMPVLWWGNIKQQADKTLVAGIYPTYYQDSIGQVKPSSVSFYHSEDEGHTWEIYGKIPFEPDGIADKRGDSRYEEPAFEILSDSTFICVMRTGSMSPMYKTFSYDHGITWTTPKPFTPNGVMPRLFHLKNGALVLISGRPGIQIRFSFDGTGQTWSDPIDLISFIKEDGEVIRDVSCGYASYIEADDNSFYLVYSDFTTTNIFGDIRKSICFRKVVVSNI